MAGISPMHQGDTYPPALFTFVDDNGNYVPLPSGTTFTLVIYNPKTNVVTNGAGSWTPTNLSQGMATYQWNAADTAIDGTFKLYVKFQTPTAQTGSTDEIQWVVLPLVGQQ